MELTREQAIAEHRKMWNWIADETERLGNVVDKDDYFSRTEAITRIPTAECFCCAYGEQFVDDKIKHIQQRCAHCPLVWDSHIDKAMCLCKEEYTDNNGLFGLWVDACTYGHVEKSVKLARQIANLQERTDNIP